MSLLITSLLVVMPEVPILPPIIGFIIVGDVFRCIRHMRRFIRLLVRSLIRLNSIIGRIAVTWMMMVV